MRTWFLRRIIACLPLCSFAHACEGRSLQAGTPEIAIATYARPCGIGRRSGLPWGRLIPRVGMLTTTGPLGTAQARQPSGGCGHVRCFGLVATPSDVFGSNPTRAECLRILSETKNAAKEEKHRMQQEIANLKQKYEDVQREMSMIRAMFESTEKMPQDLHKPEKRIGIPNANNYISPNGSPKNDVSSSQSSHEVPPPQAHRAKDIVKNFLIPSDAQGGNEVYSKSLKKPHGNVARGYILSKDPMTKVGGVELGPQYWEVQIDVAILRNEPLLRPYGNYLTIRDVVGVTVAWPYTYVKRK
uniref:Transposase Tnp1/En/Spm-like domain-containing protein n=1 Tax=Ananas comosus var. bracteatus TaxID=296719 RepID=A0A6V7PIB3_ANACO|nr:unnamed protein product [Ananas comosus var. bracteatus]